jgi:Fur family peroxide stress response transcriptional regulator
MNSSTQQNTIEQFISRCREKGLSVTPQRLVIYRAMAEDNSHPNPDMVYQKIHQEHPTISLATVYKTLETFEKHGIVSVVTTLHNSVRYDPLTKRHHHIVCVKCKKVMDLEDPGLDAINIPEEVSQKNKLIDYSVHFNVICAKCQGK